MFLSKRRIVHAVIYEVILLVVIAIALSLIFEMPIEVTGVLGVVMAVTSMIWNMVFNSLFEMYEAKYQLTRTIWVRVCHAIGFEGGLMLVTFPMIAYALNMSIVDAILLDLSLTLCILVYTFIFQWCYDHVEMQLNINKI